jgi:hypothetical protein
MPFHNPNLILLDVLRQVGGFANEGSSARKPSTSIIKQNGAFKSECTLR